jgi:hypothetical protein
MVAGCGSPSISTRNERRSIGNPEGLFPRGRALCNHARHHIRLETVTLECARSEADSARVDRLANISGMGDVTSCTYLAASSTPEVRAIAMKRGRSLVRIEATDPAPLDPDSTLDPSRFDAPITVEIFTRKTDISTIEVGGNRKCPGAPIRIDLQPGDVRALRKIGAQ